MHGRTHAIDRMNESVIDHERTGAMNHRVRHEGQAMLASILNTRFDFNKREEPQNTWNEQKSKGPGANHKRKRKAWNELAI